MSNYIVSKFGGSSVSDLVAMERSADIAIKNKSSFIVVSATSGTTNTLVEIIKKTLNGEIDNVLSLLKGIEERHINLAREAKLDEKAMNHLQSVFDELSSFVQMMTFIKQLDKKAKDFILSTGERLSSIIFHGVLNQKLQTPSHLLDARLYLKTDSSFGKAKPNLKEIEERCQALDRKKVYITQGYIGSDSEESTTTLGRGGSDYSAAIFARAMNADILQIWTDVAGIATLDPRVCKNAKPIYEITFEEASELASFGAKVLHPRTLNPVIGKNIKVFIGNSFKDEKGTWIVNSVEKAPLIRGIAIKRDQTLLTLTNPNMLHNHGFLSRIFSIFDEHQISIDLVSTSEITVALTLDCKEDMTEELLLDLAKIAKLEREDGLALVSLIGNNLNNTAGVAAELFSVIREENIRLIQYGASKYHLCFLIDEERADIASLMLHKRFLE